MLDLVFFVNSNGALSKFKTVTVVADQYDVNKDGVVALDELASAIPDGYVIDEDMQIESAPAVSYMDGFDKKHINCSIEICLNKVSSVNQTESSKDIASITDSKANKVLTNSLNTDQKRNLMLQLKRVKK